MAAAQLQQVALKKYGPWGSQCAPNFKFELSPQESIKEVNIRAGFIVDAIGFVAADACGNTTKVQFGGNGGNLHTIKLASNEYITHISGTYGVYKYTGGCLIATLKIHTNIKPNGYGPYGLGKDVSGVHSFSSPNEPGCAVAGFFGKDSQYLESIGVYERQLPIKKYGPWGSKCATNWDFETGSAKVIKEVIIRSGFIVDGIGFVTGDKCGRTSTEYFGGQGGDLHKITLAPGEYITHISGTYGTYKHGGQCLIATLKIHTNCRPNGYGPYGQGRDVTNVCSFTSPGSATTGFFGRAGQYLESIGVYAQ